MRIGSLLVERLGVLIAPGELANCALNGRGEIRGFDAFVVLLTCSGVMVRRVVSVFFSHPFAL
jgi:hypothetical protein